MENPAPIALFVYNRPKHTLKTLEALQKNVLAGQSELFVFSDVAKSTKDKQKVAFPPPIQDFTAFSEHKKHFEGQYVQVY